MGESRKELLLAPALVAQTGSQREGLYSMLSLIHI